jgi:hypothetical protein
MSRILLISSFILMFGCTNQKGEKNHADIIQSSNSFYTIDFPTILENKREIQISEIATSIEYILLESKGKSVLGRIRDAAFTKDYIFISAFGTPLLAQFDQKGNFIRFIGKIGRGPEEYDLLRQFSIDEKSELVYIQPNWTRNILVYSFDGKYVKTIKLNRDERSIVWDRDSIFMCYSEPSIGNEKYVFKETSHNGDTLQTVTNYCLWKDPPPFGRMMSYPGQRFFYRTDNRLHFKGMYNDTVYTYNDDYKIIPKLSVNLGKFKLPEEMIFERGLVRRIPTDYYWVAVNESSSYVFLYYSAYDTEGNQGPGNEILKAGHMIYEKKSGSGTALKNNEGKMILFNIIGKWGFKNDIDGGPELIPEYTNDSTAFHFISSLSIKKYLASDEFKNSTPKDQNKKKNLMDQMSGLKESDNDILMVVRLK